LPYQLRTPIAVNRPPQNRELIRLDVAAARGLSPRKRAISKLRKLFQIFLDLLKKFPNSRAWLRHPTFQRIFSRAEEARGAGPALGRRL